MSVIGQEPRERINQLFERHVNSGKVEFFRNAGIDFIFGRREGVYVYDIDGKRRLDQLQLQRRRLQPRAPQPRGGRGGG